jgi:hypothetical protein
MISQDCSYSSKLLLICLQPKLLPLTEDKKHLAELPQSFLLILQVCLLLLVVDVQHCGVPLDGCRNCVKLSLKSVKATAAAALWSQY